MKNAKSTGTRFRMQSQRHKPDLSETRDSTGSHLWLRGLKLRGWNFRQESGFGIRYSTRRHFRIFEMSKKYV